MLIRASGEVDVATRVQLHDALERAARMPLPGEGPGHLVLDLTEVQFFAAAGLHCLCDASATLDGTRRGLVLVCRKDGIPFRVLSMPGVAHRWVVHHELAAALADIDTNA